MAAPRAVLTDDAASTVRGIVVVIGAYILMSLGDVSAKWSLAAAGVVGAMVWRGVFGAGTVAILAVAQGRWRRLRPVRWHLVALRSALHCFVSLSWYLAWLSMSLADSYAIGFTAPLLMTLLAIPMLGERLHWRRSLSTAIGFCGVLIMVRPGSALWTPAVALLLLGVAAMAVSRTMTRLLSTTETPECLAFWLLATHIPVGLLIGLATDLPAFTGDGHYTAVVWGALLLLGLTNGLAHWLQSRAYAMAPVSALAPYEYTTLIWGGVLGFLVFSEVPSFSALAGAAVVAAAGLYNLHRERVRRAESAATPASDPALIRSGQTHALPDRA
jgi:drug/metabolite transporter (DMT)-like permease